MNAFASYRAVSAKLSARKSSFFTDKEWNKVLEYKSLDQFVDFLKQKEQYKRFFNEYRTAEDLHRMDLEVLLEKYIVIQIEDILHYFSNAYKSFLKVLLMEYEINDLLLIIRFISKDEDVRDSETHFLHSRKYSKLPYEKLISCKDIIQFVDLLKGSIYYDTLKTLTHEDVVKREFHMEMKLYILFFKTLIEKSAQLSKKDHGLVKEIIGMKIDLLNVQWIYRATKFYDIFPEEVLIYCLPYGRMIDYKKLKKLCYSQSSDEFKYHANKYLRFDLFKEENDTFLGNMMNRYIYKQLSGINQNNEDISVVLAYIYKLGIELEDLVAVTESIRYSMPEGSVKKYLAHILS